MVVDVSEDMEESDHSGCGGGNITFKNRIDISDVDPSFEDK